MMISNNNKKLGNKYELEFLKILKMNGYWCHLFAYNKNGQPCDIIGVKDDLALLIDVKHCVDDRFDFSHIQPNQMSCFEYAEFCGNKNVGFAIYFEKQQGWYWLPYDKDFFKDKKSVKYDELERF